MTFSRRLPTLRLRPPALSAARLWQALRRLVPLLFAGTLLATIGTCSTPGPQLEQVLAQGTLRVAIVNSPTTYYESPAGPTGFDYELVQRLAQDLGVTLELIVVSSSAEALDALRADRAHLAATGIAVSRQREIEFRFTPPLATVRSELVYRMGSPRPASLDALEGTLKVARDSVYAERLAAISADHPELYWEEVDEVNTEALLYAVAEGQLDYTIASSHLVASHQRYYPQLRVAFTLTEEQPLAWAFPGHRDRSLYDRTVQFLETFPASELAIIRDRHFAHAAPIDYVSSVALANHVESRLPRYRQYFEEAAAQYDLDWRLLAAMGYQESHWDPAAVSPTGVRGIMMLTMATARFLDVADREDPRQSIFGGARYFRRLLDQLAEVPEPDRSWLALVGYNLGYGHLIDARKLTAERGGDPNRWVDVREALPLLTQRQYHSQTRYGYARGYEALKYVGNIRTYYDMLVWMTEGRSAEPTPEPAPAAPEPRPTEPTPEPLNPLTLDPPLL
jgi:membrane-bound lytic murein transglycosylase F